MRNLTLSAASAVTAFAASAAMAAPVAVDLSTWTAESVGGANWVLAADNNSVTQTVNGAPTVFFSEGDSQGTALSGTITVNTTGDDDFIGFVLGFDSGDLASAEAPGFLLLDWKQGAQSGTSPGLVLSRVTGPVNGLFSSTQRAAALTELARGTTLGETGWIDQQTYDFEIVFTDSLIQVFVDDLLEISVEGAFANGSFGFYNNSQGNVTYGSIGEAVVIDAIPLPAAAFLFGPVALAGFAARRRAKT